MVARCVWFIETFPVLGFKSEGEEKVSWSLHFSPFSKQILAYNFFYVVTKVIKQLQPCLRSVSVSMKYSFQELALENEKKC